MPTTANAFCVPVTTVCRTLLFAERNQEEQAIEEPLHMNARARAFVYALQTTNITRLPWYGGTMVTMQCLVPVLPPQTYTFHTACPTKGRSGYVWLSGKSCFRATAVTNSTIHYLANYSSSYRRVTMRHDSRVPLPYLSHRNNRLRPSLLWLYGDMLLLDLLTAFRLT